MLERLAPFVGDWKVEAIFSFPTPPDVEARCSFEWALDGAFLLQRSTISLEVAPDGLCVIAPDGEGEFRQHYFDSRGVVRVYDMTFDGRVWTLARLRPDFSDFNFSQRWRGEFSADGSRIEGTWEAAEDHETWRKDFDMIYTRA